MKNLKKNLCFMLTSVLCLGNTALASGISNAEQILPSEMETRDFLSVDEILALELPAQKENLTPDQQDFVQKTIDVSYTDAAASAQILNQTSDPKILEAGVKEILDNYYSDFSNQDTQEKIKIFSSAISPEANELLDNYKEAQEERSNAKNLNYETGEIIATFEPGTLEEEISNIAKQIGHDYRIISDFKPADDLPDFKLKRMGNFNETNFPISVSMDIGLDKTVARAEQILESLPCVAEAEPNHTDIQPASVSSALGSNDPYTNEQTYLQQVNVPTAWFSWWASPRFAFFSGKIQVAVIDTGLDINHPDLTNMYSKDKSISFVSNGTTVTTEKMNLANCYWRSATDARHGTHVAGIIAAQTNNKTGVAGITSIFDKINGNISNSVELIAINASYVDTDKTSSFRYADLAEAIYYAVNQGAEVINMSLYGSFNDKAVENAINYAYARNVVVCACAGNTADSSIQYPASCDHVVSVASVDKNNTKASYSTFNEYVDITAPGSYEPTSEEMGGIFNCVLDGKYARLQGTSMATPIVSAAAAILYSMNPSYTPAQIEDILYRTATDLYTTGKDIYTGNGLINIGLAVQNAKAHMLIGDYPKNANATRRSYNSISIKWNASDLAERYLLYRSTAPNGTYQKIASVPADFGQNIYEYVDNNLVTGTTYYYKVRTACIYQDSFRFGDYSPAINATCTLSKPTLSLIVGNGKITASWNKINGASGYRIYRATTKDGSYTRLKTLSGINALTYADTTVKSGKVYYYKVRAYQKINEDLVFSAYSDIISKKAK
ncbi:MAG: S8 family serine peptidase [Lachnospiraceae bacterium]|nr:S8 family serine peptidase [Lachnospiraceae bacterium]